MYRDKEQDPQTDLTPRNFANICRDAIFPGHRNCARVRVRTEHQSGRRDPGALLAHQYNLDSNGHDWLIASARTADEFLLGELHGDEQIPELLHALWREMWKLGYHHLAAEISPWDRIAKADAARSLDAAAGERHLATSGDSKILYRFGRNHLHRGYDARGISTLGNFIAEYAIAHHRTVFNVGAFGAGGKATLMGETFDADECADELTFALLAEAATSPATVYDLRPLGPILHRIPHDKRTPLQNYRIYWSDSCDALIYFRNVTPLRS